MSRSPFSLAGKRALVTGSGGGIGLALARGLAEAGAAVILNGRDAGKLRAAAKRLAADGLTAEAAAFDITDEAAVARAVQRLTAKGRSIDILVNNAGIQIRAPLLEFSLESWRRVLDTNLTGAFLVARAVVPGMIARGGGKVINIGSLGTDLSRPNTGPYCAAKGGLRMLTRAMGGEWAARNIQVNGISPGYIHTEMTQVLLDDAQFDAWVRSRTPAARWGTPQDLAGACVFLSSAAADFVNGQMLFVDGGFTAISGNHDVASYLRPSPHLP